ncbi:MAG TPA: hypothetical protein GX724_06045 [Fibrobacter sp.]|nr:hypothetical protein [Fibrobacter sp.]
MGNTEHAKINYAKALIRAGLQKELILKITAISTYQYDLLQKELQVA